MRAAEYVDRILRGARPDDMPVYTPDKYELVINLKDRKGAGSDDPSSVAATGEWRDSVGTMEGNDNGPQR